MIVKNMHNNLTTALSALWWHQSGDFERSTTAHCMYIVYFFYIVCVTFLSISKTNLIVYASQMLTPLSNPPLSAE